MALSTDTPQTWRRYTSVAIALHWAIALLMIGQIGIGLWMADAIKATDPAVRAMAFEQIQLHKAIGITVLGLTVLRLAWRILHPAPPLPPRMSGFERFAAHASHFGFYGLMLAMPLTGWAMTSASVEFGSVPTVYFGLGEIPKMPFLPDMAVDAKEAAEGALRNAHATLGWLAIALIALHVAAALKHHFVDGDAVLARMVPGLAPRRPVVDPPMQAAPLGLRAIAAIAVLGAAVGGGVWVAQSGGGPPKAQADMAPAPEMAAEAPMWTPVMDESELAFVGEYNVDAFRGVFERWSAQIAFDPDQLDLSEVIVQIDVASAATGNPWYDPELAGAAWFNPAEHPEAIFRATDFERDEAADADGALGFVAKGVLNLRGVELPQEMAFVLRIDGERAEARGSADVDRVAFGVGVEASEGGNVSPVIGIEITLIAERAAP